MASRVLFGIGGQSNAVGVADGSTLSAANQFYLASCPDVLFAAKMARGPDEFVASGWDIDIAAGNLAPHAHVTNPGGAQTYLGVELALGRTLSQRIGPGRVGIATFAISDSSLAGEWGPDCAYPPGDTNLFSQWMTFLRTQETAMNAKLAGIVWIQGNNDAANLGRANAYGGRLQKLFDRIRAAFSTALVITYDRLAEVGGTNPQKKQVRAGQDAVDNRESGIYMVNSDDIPKRTDQPAHYTADGTITLGVRFADAIYPIPGRIDRFSARWRQRVL